MKHAIRFGLVITFILGGVFYVTFNVQADEIYQSTYNPSEETCFHVQNGEDPECDDAGTGNDSFEVRFEQELVIQQDSSDPEITFSSLDIFSHSCSRNGTWWANTVAYLMDDNDYSNYVANSYNPVSSRATSTAITWDCANTTTTFNFITPYVKTASNELTWFVVDTSVPPSGTYMFPRQARTFGLYPSTGGFTDVFDGHYGYGATHSDIGDDYDWQFILYRDDTPVTFTYPTNNSLVNDNPLPIQGTCNDTVELFIYDGVSYASSTNAFGSSATCSDNTFSHSIILDTGYWSAFASSTNGTAGIVFYYLAQNFDEPGFLNPFVGEEDSNESVWDFLKDFAGDRLNFRPYSYLPQTVAELYISLNNATSSDWIANIEVMDGEEIPGITSALFDDIDSDFKTNIRTFSTFVLYAAFIFHLWKIGHRFL